MVSAPCRDKTLKQTGAQIHGFHPAVPVQELACFRALAQRESLSLPARKRAAEARLTAQLQREEELQKRYKQLTSDLADAKQALQQAGA